MDGMRDLVSVIIPTYNRVLECKRAIRSVLTQTYGNLEIVVVDDGSTDDTRDQLQGMDDRIKYVWQPNAGVSAARNRGLKEATGEYIGFLDSDDEWLPWKVDAQLSVLKAFPTAGMVWTDMAAVDEKGSVLHQSHLKIMYDAYAYFDRDRHFQESRMVSDVWANCPTDYSGAKCYGGNIFSWMFMGNLVHTSTVLVRRDRQRKVGEFDVTLQKSGEDYDFHLRTCRIGDVAYLDIPSVRYRIGASDQLTEGKYMAWAARNNLKTVKKIMESARQEIKLPESMIRKRMAICYAWVGMEEFLEDRKKAGEYLRESLSWRPFQVRVGLFFALSFLPISIYHALVGIKRTAWKVRKKTAQPSPGGGNVER